MNAFCSTGDDAQILLFTLITDGHTAPKVTSVMCGATSESLSAAPTESHGSMSRCFSSNVRNPSLPPVGSSQSLS